MSGKAEVCLGIAKTRLGNSKKRREEGGVRQTLADDMRRKLAGMVFRGGKLS